ncbi:hypothetical protein SPSIL_014280 [Sporomusa silvacetica DSM 10669]|uniref:Apea-like HEPN domain-containing protein n=1 Tax=Sporomusa silvacetica DSM 10669 TaxID=1123289 RepID=A0ABZ3II33_9FIRM|nr:hypothetical protein [Sporomusa silvacetica]OZC21491.1 hypothetical protein SPSIL_09010 [Sporomusa silvacetica DSM 10669]
MSQSNRPILLTLKDLLKPISLAKKNINETQKNDQLSEFVIQGVFVLLVSRFEIMITDILLYYLKWMPNKLEFKEAKFSKDELLSEILINLQIEKSVNSLSYKNLREVLDFFFHTLSINVSDKEKYIDKLIEIKETRNLLLHNNLIVNRNYIEKAGILKRSDRLEDKLKLDKQYLIEAKMILESLIFDIEKSLIEKYSNYSKIVALKSLWNYLFTSPIMNFEDYWIIDEASDSIIALKRYKYEDGLSGSERLFLGMWRAHFNGDGDYLKKFNMRSFDGKRKEQMLYFLSVVGEISFY